VAGVQAPGAFGNYGAEVSRCAAIPGGGALRGRGMSLLTGTSLYDLKLPQMPSAADLMVRDGLRIFTAAAAMIRVPESFFRAFSKLTPLRRGLSSPASTAQPTCCGGCSMGDTRWLAGALRRIGRGEAADEIVSMTKAASYDVRESDPFAAGAPLVLPGEIHPIVGRLNAIWESMRRRVIEVLPPAPGLPRDREWYLRLVDDMYQSNADHSLSIEGYSVSMELIERVRAGDWNPETYDADRKGRDGLAARGYWQAVSARSPGCRDIIAGGNAAQLVRKSHREWYRTDSALCGWWADSGSSTRPGPKQCRLPTHIAIRCAPMGSRG